MTTDEIANWEEWLACAGAAGGAPVSGRGAAAPFCATPVVLRVLTLAASGLEVHAAEPSLTIRAGLRSLRHLGSGLGATYVTSGRSLAQQMPGRSSPRPPRVPRSPTGA